MPIVENDKWKSWEKTNSDPYGKCCVDVARETMRLLDLPENEKFDTHTIVCKADKNISAGGITGFMAGCVAQMVSEVHSRGEEFRKAWNKDHGVDEEKAKGGTVNPAIMTVDTDKL